MILEYAGYAEDSNAVEDSGGEWGPREARRRRWQTSDLADVAGGGEHREACTGQMKIREGRGRRRRCGERGSCRSLEQHGWTWRAMDGQGRLWQMWKIQKRQKRAKALMARDGGGWARGAVE